MKGAGLINVSIAVILLVSAVPTVARDDKPASDVSIRDAIWGAATDPEHGVFGRFSMKVVATGRKDGEIYLNSERDYRDQRNLTVVVLPKGQKQLATTYGADADQALSGRTIRVTGIAMRVKIVFFGARGEPTDKYYYQTQVQIVDPRQIELAA